MTLRRAETAAASIEALARSYWSKDHKIPSCSPSQIPTIPALVLWLFSEAPAETCQTVYQASVVLATSETKDGTIFVNTTYFLLLLQAHAERVFSDFFKDDALANLIAAMPLYPTPAADELHALWKQKPEEDWPPESYPLATAVRAWQNRPQTDPKKALVTLTGAGYTRKAEIRSTLERVSWQPDTGSVSAIQVDGEPVGTRLSDLSYIFPSKGASLSQHGQIYKPREPGTRKLPGVKPIPPNIRLMSLSSWGRKDSILTGDMLTLLAVAHVLDRALQLGEREWAALLARTKTGGYRRPQEGDVRRVWKAAAALMSSIFDPSGSGRWLNLAHIEGIPARRALTIGPPEWRKFSKGDGQRFTLTAEGSRAARQRIVAGRSGAAGRLITGIEYRLAARYDGKPGVAPDLRPASGKTGPGPIVHLPLFDVLRYAGDYVNEHDPQSVNAARQRFDRMVSRLDQVGYFVPHHGHASAEAGDAVEIVQRVRGGRHRPAGLKVRASARFVEAARQANLKGGTGFRQMSLTEWLGMKDMEESDEGQ